MTRKLLQSGDSDSLSATVLIPADIASTPTTITSDMHTHRMGSVLEERRDPNFNSWTEIIPDRVKNAHKR
jgi:hypothetical protein